MTRKQFEKEVRYIVTGFLIKEQQVTEIMTLFDLHDLQELNNQLLEKMENEGINVKDIREKYKRENDE